MSILSGYKKVKKYIKQSDGYQLVSQLTRSQTVEMDNGTTLEETISSINDTLNQKIDSSSKGTKNGVAELDANGIILSSQLPSYVDDVVEGYFYNNKFYKESSHTTIITGESGKIYIDLSTNKTYRWSGSAFVVVSETIALGETSSTAYRGDKGKIAYDHSQTVHAPSDAEANQNAFSSLVIYNNENQATSVIASYPTDNIVFKAGNNVQLETNNKTITISSGANDTNTSISYDEGETTYSRVSCENTGVEISAGEAGEFYAKANKVTFSSNAMELCVGSNVLISGYDDGEVYIDSIKTNIGTSTDEDFTINNKSIFELIY